VRTHRLRAAALGALAVLALSGGPAAAQDPLPRIVGGGTFGLAPVVPDGAHADQLRENELLFYAVDLPDGWGAVVRVTLLGDPEGPASRTTTLEVAAYDAARQSLPDLAAAAPFGGVGPQLLEVAAAAPGSPGPPGPLRHVSVRLRSQEGSPLEGRAYPLRIELLRTPLPIPPGVPGSAFQDPGPAAGGAESTTAAAGAESSTAAASAESTTAAAAPAPARGGPSGVIPSLIAAALAFGVATLAGVLFVWIEHGRPPLGPSAPTASTWWEGR